DIDAIEIGHEIAKNQERNQPPHHLADCTLLYVFHGTPPALLIAARSKRWTALVCDYDGDRRGVQVGRHCEELLRRSNPAFLCNSGLLRGACHRAGIRPSRWLAMTTRLGAFPPIPCQNPNGAP